VAHLRERLAQLEGSDSPRRGTKQR